MKLLESLILMGEQGTALQRSAAHQLILKIVNGNKEMWYHPYLKPWQAHGLPENKPDLSAR